MRERVNKENETNNSELNPIQIDKQQDEQPCKQKWKPGDGGYSIGGNAAG